MTQYNKQETLNPGSYNDFTETLEKISTMSRAEIVTLYSSALAKYKESLNLDKSSGHLDIL